MVWSQKFRKSEISLDAGNPGLIIIMRGVDGTFWLLGLVVPGLCKKIL